MDEKANKKYAKLKAEIDKNNNALMSTVTGLKAGIEKGISVLKADQKKTQEYLEQYLGQIIVAYFGSPT